MKLDPEWKWIKSQLPVPFYQRTIPTGCVGITDPVRRSVLDVNPGQSGFPAWLAAQGYAVTIGDLDPKHLQHQERWQDEFRSHVDIICTPLSRLVTRCFDVTVIRGYIESPVDRTLEVFSRLARMTRDCFICITHYDLESKQVYTPIHEKTPLEMWIPGLETTIKQVWSNATAHVEYATSQLDPNRIAVKFTP